MSFVPLHRSYCTGRMIGNRCATQETSTALVLACVEAGDLSAARRVHAEARAAGLALQLRAHNALINALGRATRPGRCGAPPSCCCG